MVASSANRQAFRSPRRAGLFWKLVLLALVLTVAAVFILSRLFSNAYAALLERELDERLRHQAATMAELLVDDWPSEPNATIQELVKRAAERSEMRVTLLDVDGRVMADSAASSVAAVRAMESHVNRAEFMSALRTGQGAARRKSPTVGERFKYRAVRVERDDEPLGVLRTAAPTVAIAAEIEMMGRWVWTIGLLMAVAAVAITYWFARRWTDPLRTLARAAEGLAAGHYDGRLKVAVGANDEVSGIAAALNELGKRLAQRERQLHSTSETQNTILEAMTESVIAVDRGEKVLFANASASRALGFDAKRAQEMTLLEAVRSHELRAILHKALRSNQYCNAELTWHGKTLRVFDVLATPLPGDPPPGVVLVLRDVSELKRLEQMRQQFIANVSHELKTPLSSIKAYAETLLGGARNDPVHCERFLSRIDEQASHLHQLILDMLSLARIESGQASLDLVDVPVSRVAERCLADYEPHAAARQVTLASVSSDPGLKVRADEEALRQILSNLIDNAIKYTPAGGRVTVDWRADGNVALIEVADSGIGIAPEHHDRLFERFYRVDRARSRELGGTGLGLSIVKHLSQAMGGSVSISSQVASGSRFTVRIPISMS